MLSPKGHNIAVFCVFLAIATVLWFAMSAGEEVQRDVHCRLKITNVPDSVKCISRIPPSLNVSVSGAGTSIFGVDFGRTKTLRIDWRFYARDGQMYISADEMRSIVRNAFGSGITVQGINPDTLHLQFTSQKPVRLPVAVDSRITTLPNCTLIGTPKPNIDSVTVYSAQALPKDFRVVPTQVLQLNDISKSTVARVALKLPKDCMAEPDSVDVRVTVEPMISRSAVVPVTAVNVPKGYRMLLMPNMVKVSYAVPMSKYSDNGAKFKVTADFAGKNPESGTNRVAIKVKEASGSLLDVYTEIDSVEFIAEKQ